MFVTQAFEGIDLEMKNYILKETQEKLYPISCKDKKWFID